MIKLPFGRFLTTKLSKPGLEEEEKEEESYQKN